MKDIKAFITGATGFIGGRIAERLWLDYGVKSNCLAHNYTNAARLARLPVKIYKGDLLDRASIKDAIEGCNAVFHCAYGNTKDPQLNRKINEDGIKILGKIALEKGIKKFIYLSSVAVYGPNSPEEVNEMTPVSFTEDEYGNSKIRAEQICKELQSKGLPVTIIRPTIVFGPFSPIWTIGIIKRIKIGGWENIKGNDGLCNAVYIDDLVEALFLCIKLETAYGETFIISGDKPVTWNEFFESHIRLADLPIPRKVSRTRSKIKSVLSRCLKANMNILRKWFEPHLLDIYQTLKNKNPDLVFKLDGLIRGGIKKNEVGKFCQRTIFSIDKARNILGYSPRSFHEGMEMTAQWLKHHEYI
jgi:nucleoside-diphosphate-sugar epimerase